MPARLASAWICVCCGLPATGSRQHCGARARLLQLRQISANAVTQNHTRFFPLTEKKWEMGFGSSEMSGRVRTSWRLPEPSESVSFWRPRSGSQPFLRHLDGASLCPLQSSVCPFLAPFLGAGMTRSPPGPLGHTCSAPFLCEATSAQALGIPVWPLWEGHIILSTTVPKSKSGRG